VSYDHTQRGSIHWIVGAAASAMLVGAAVAAVMGAEVAIAITLAATALSLLAVAACIAWLRVHDDGDALRISFGPLPLFRRRIRYDAIRGAQPTRTRWHHGVGIHSAPGGGWTWNVAIGDAVEITLENGRVIVGSDDAAALAAFLRGRIARR
jgi:hypothetical protein